MMKSTLCVGGLSLTCLFAFVLSQPSPLCYDDAVVFRTDLQFLEAVFNCTDGPNWLNNDGWSFPPKSDPCSTTSPWAGVICQNSTSMTGLDLYAHGLNGPWPAGLIDLNITFWDISYNQITGPLPWLSDRFGGQGSGGMQLENNIFTAWKHPFPPAISGMTIDNNNITEVPDVALLGSTGLQSFSLRNNQIQSVPNLSLLPSIQSVDMSFQRNGGLRGGIPPIKSLTLQVLSLSLNPLLGGPLPDFSLMPALTSFSCAQCGLTGSLKAFAAANSSMSSIYVPSNTISGPIPDFLTALPLVQLTISENPISGTVPSSWSILQKSQPFFILDVADCDLTGPFPGNLCQHFSTLLNACDASGNSFSNCSAINGSCCNITC